MVIINYRKATISDLNDISILVTNLLEKCGFELLKDLGDTYYKDNGYCNYCVNRDKECNKCKAELWIKN